MGLSPNVSEDDILHELLEALQQIPDSRAGIEARNVAAGVRSPPGSSSRSRDLDALVEAEVAGHRVMLAVECKQHAFPRDVMTAVWQLRDFISSAEHGPEPWIPVLAAVAVSPGARDILRNEGVGYFDTGGSLYLPAPGMFVFIDRPMPKQAERRTGAIFRGRRAQVLHAVWALRHEWFGVNQIAEKAMVAPATASETLATLERHGWVTAKGAGPAKMRRLDDPQGFLDAWAEHQQKERSPQLRRYYVPAGPVQPLMRHLHEACEEKGVLYEMTGEAAGHEYAPYLTSISQLRCRMMIGSSSEAVLREMGARQVDEGWNLGVLDADNEGAFAFREMGQYGWLASPLQTYLDLLQGSGRSREMAQHLRQERLQ